MGQLLHSRVGNDANKLDTALNFQKRMLAHNFYTTLNLLTKRSTIECDSKPFSRKARAIFLALKEIQTSWALNACSETWNGFQSNHELSWQFFERLCNCFKTNCLTWSILLLPNIPTIMSKTQNPQAVSFLNGWCHYAHRGLHYPSLDSY